MNNTRRKEIARIRGQLEELSAKLSELHGDIDNVLSEEQEAFDAMPESLQEGERGQTMQTALDNLHGALDEADTLTSAVDDCANYLEEAAQ